MRFREDRQCHVFVRPFDPVRDVLYIALDKFDDFCFEAYDRQAQPDLLAQIVDVIPDLNRIAVPEALLLRSEAAALLPDMFEWFFRLAALFIIVDAQPDFEDDDGTNVPRRWELESSTQRTAFFFWNHDRGGFDVRDADYIGDGALYRRIEEANKELAKVLAENRIRKFEIRPVFAQKMNAAS